MITNNTSPYMPTEKKQKNKTKMIKKKRKTKSKFRTHACVCVCMCVFLHMCTPINRYETRRWRRHSLARRFVA